MSNILTSLLACLFLINPSNDEIDYNMTLYGLFESSETKTENGYVDIHTVFDMDTVPKYLIYVVKSEFSEEIDYKILLDDEQLFNNVLLELLGTQIGKKEEGYFKNIKGLTAKVEIKNDKSVMPAYFIMTSKKKYLYRILFIAPTEKKYKQYFEEFKRSMNTFKLLF